MLLKTLLSISAFFLIVAKSYAEVAIIRSQAGSGPAAKIDFSPDSPNSVTRHGEGWHLVLKGRTLEPGLEVRAGSNFTVSQRGDQVIVDLYSTQSSFEFKLISYSKDKLTLFNQYHVDIRSSPLRVTHFMVKLAPAFLGYSQTTLPSLNTKSLVGEIEYHSLYFLAPAELSFRAYGTLASIGGGSSDSRLKTYHLAGSWALRLIRAPELSFSTGIGFSGDYASSASGLIGYDFFFYPGLNAAMNIAFSEHKFLATRLDLGFIFKNSGPSFNSRDIRFSASYHADDCVGEWSCILETEISSIRYLLSAGQSLSFSSTLLKFGIGF